MDFIKGNVNKIYLRLLISAVGGAIIVSLYSFVDTIAIGRGIGADGVAVIAVVTPLFSVAAFIGLIFGVGGCVLWSKERGLGNSGNHYFTAAVISIEAITGVFGVISWFLREPIFSFFGASNELMPLTLEYANTIDIAFPLFVSTAFLPCFLRNDNAHNFILVSTVIGAGLNILGDWLFVFPLQMGMFGAALASALSVLIQTALMCVHFFKKKCTLKLCKPQAFIKSFGKIFTNGFGSGISEISVIVSTVIINRQIMRYDGETALAVFGVIITVYFMLQHIYCGVAQAAQPIVSINYGSKNSKNIFTVFKSACVTMAIFVAVSTAICYIFPNGIIRLFIEPTTEILNMTPHMFYFYFAALPFLALNILAIFYLQSLVKPKTALGIAILRGIILNVVLVYTLPLVLKTDGIWWSVVITEAITALMSLAAVVVFNINLKKELADEKQTD